MVANTEPTVNSLFLSLDQPILPLAPGSKAPASEHGLKDAIPLSRFVEADDHYDFSNYGIRLDNLVCVDFDSLEFADDPDIAEFYAECLEDGTWRQATGGEHRGVHFLYSAPQIASGGQGFAKIIAASGRPFGEIKCGPGHYIVGPGSVVEVEYVLLTKAPPRPLTATVRRFFEAGKSKRTKLKDLANDLGSDSPFGATDRERMLILTGKLREAGLSPQRAAQAAQRMQSWPDFLPNFDSARPFEFSDLRKMADEWQVNPPPEKKKTPAIVSWAYIAKNPLPPVAHYCYEMRLRVGAGPTLLTGHSGAKKTALLLHIGACLVTGDLLFGVFQIRTKPKEVIFLSIDMPEDDAWRRIGHLPGTPSDKFLFVDWSRRGFDEADFEQLLLAHPGAFILVDCYADVASSIAPRQNDHEGLGTRKLISDLRQAFVAAKADGIITDHTTRPSEKPKSAADNIIGSAQKRASIRSGLTMRVYTDAEMKAIASPITNKYGAVVTYAIIETMKQGESGSVAPINVAFTEDVFLGPNNEVLGEAHTPVFISPPISVKKKGFSFADVPSRIPVTEKNHKKRVADLVEWLLANPGQHTQTEMIDAKALNNNYAKEVLTDPAFKFVGKQGLKKLYELAGDSASVDKTAE